MLPGALRHVLDAFALVSDPADRANLLIAFAEMPEGFSTAK